MALRLRNQRIEQRASAIDEIRVVGRELQERAVEPRGVRCEFCGRLHAVVSKGRRARAISIRKPRHAACIDGGMIRKLPSGKYRLYSRKVDPRTGKRRNLGTFATRAGAERHERAVQYFKRH